MASPEHVQIATQAEDEDGKQVLWGAQLFLSPYCEYDFLSSPGRKYHIRVSELGAKVVVSL